MISTQRIQQWKFKRYSIYVQYATIFKIYNFAKALFNWYFGRSINNAQPSYLRVETTRKCEVGCLLCHESKSNTFYPFDLYKNLIDKFKSTLIVVSLYDIGEPLEVKNLTDFISYANNNKIGTIISTSLSVEREEDFWVKLVNSGLDRIVVSIDGVTKDVYNKYRKNGDFNLVIQNLERLIYYKKKYNSSLIVEWQIIDFPWNQDELEPARVFSKEKGCDDFRIIQEAANARIRALKSSYIRTKNCFHPYFSLNITAFNEVRPCCKIHDTRMTLGNLSNNSFEEIWNGNNIKEIRDKNLIQCRFGCKTCQE